MCIAVERAYHGNCNSYEPVFLLLKDWHKGCEWSDFWRIYTPSYEGEHFRVYEFGIIIVKISHHLLNLLIVNLGYQRKSGYDFYI